MSEVSNTEIQTLIQNNPFPKLKKEIDSIISMAGHSYISGTDKVLYHSKRMDYYCLCKFILKEPNQLTILKELYENIHNEDLFKEIINKQIKEEVFSYKRCNHKRKTLFQEVLYRMIITFYEKDMNSHSEEILKHILQRLKLLDNEECNFTIDIEKTIKRYNNIEYHNKMETLKKEMDNTLKFNTIKIFGTIKTK